ncbi:hypothetical protein KBD33_02055 [Candidatus Gracilibacteria bacterium]|nr:hypothetical protein [Candidatus Gracilibacteria bacterium]
MTLLIWVVGGYSILWFISMYIILRRLHTIRRRTEKRLHDFDSEYIFPAYNYPWVFSVAFGILSYFLSVIVIVNFIKP